MKDKSFKQRFAAFAPQNQPQFRKKGSFRQAKAMVTKMKDLNETVYDAGLMPILFADEEGCAERVVKAVEQTDIPAVEILQRGELALKALKEAVKVKKKSYIGAGTVCTLEHCKRLVDLGADFIVSPGYNAELVRWCVKNNVPVVPGVSSPSELMAAQSEGVKTVKLFPFFELGGEPFLNGISGPFPGVNFIITGGLDDRGLHYLSNRKIAAIGGVWFFQDETVHDVFCCEKIVERINISLDIARHYRNGWQ